MSSLDLARDHFCSVRMPLFRFFSVDGAHTAEATRADMHVGACHLAEGGVLVVDDVFNNLFLGVTEGIFSMLALNRERLAPFLIITGKIYMTTPAYHARYLAAAEAFFIPRYGAYTDAQKTNVAGWRVVSHSVPVHADITSTPERAGRVAAELAELLSLPITA